MKNMSIITRANKEGKDITYLFEIKFEDGSSLDFPVKGYYVTCTPLKPNKKIDSIEDEAIIDRSELEELLMRKHTQSVLVLEVEKELKKYLPAVEDSADSFVDELMDLVDISMSPNGYISTFLTDLFPDRDISSLNTPKQEVKEEEEIDAEIEHPNVTFADVAGLDEVKEEFQDIIDMFENKAKFKKFGVKTPYVLLSGSPGNGKTLLTKALAGETGYNFISKCGSDFVNKYVGVGADNVRKLFEKARKHKPCIVFLDEIDAVGGKRSDDGNSSEDNKTLNQLLVEIADKEKNEDIFVIGATNRPDMLDEALVRSGRLEKEIEVPNPDVRTREEVLELYSNQKPLSDDVDLNVIAKQTSGLSCADMEAIVNDACLLAIRRDADAITQQDLTDAIERLIAGISKKNMVIDEDTKKRVCYHELGHLLLTILSGTNELGVISIIGGNGSLGYITHNDSSDDKFLYTREELEDRIKISLGGLCAEEIFFGTHSTGVSGDLESVTSTAERIVTSYGMSKVGRFALNRTSAKVQELVYEEINAITNKCYEQTKQTILDNRGLIEYLAKELLEKEKLTGEEVNKLVCNYKKSLDKVTKKN